MWFLFYTPFLALGYHHRPPTLPHDVGTWRTHLFAYLQHIYEFIKHLRVHLCRLVSQNFPFGFLIHTYLSISSTAACREILPRLLWYASSVHLFPVVSIRMQFIISSFIPCGHLQLAPTEWSTLANYYCCVLHCLRGWMFGARESQRTINWGISNGRAVHNKQIITY